jgi:hypothetical protein
MFIPSIGDSLATFSAKSPLQRAVLKFSEGQPEIQRTFFGVPFYLGRAALQ